MKISFKTKEVKSRIFLFEFKNHYDLCMTFLRYQEYYESPNPKFRGKIFKILDFMDWYSKKSGENCFLYPKDWAGFNLPAHIIPDIYLNDKLQDPNDYDYAMYKAWFKCHKKYRDGNFYIIGALENNIDTVKHEIAHGLFFIDPEYKKAMTAMVKVLNPTLKREIFEALKKWGYTTKVYIDECQAFLATSTIKELRYYFKSIKNENKPFVKFFKNQGKLWKL